MLEEPASPPAAIAQRSRDGITILRLPPRFTREEGVTEFSAIVQALIEAGRKHVVVDVGQVSYMDEFGLERLVREFISTRRAGGAVKLLNTTKRVAFPLKVLTTLLAVFESFDDGAEAVASFLSKAGQ